MQLPQEKRWYITLDLPRRPFKEELRAAKEEEQSVRNLQQRQLDVLTVQMRDSDQRLCEVTDAIAELFNKQKTVHDLLSQLTRDISALKEQSQQQDPPMTTTLSLIVEVI